jgi:hypothetical protein
MTGGEREVRLAADDLQADDDSELDVGHQLHQALPVLRK